MPFSQSGFDIIECLQDTHDKAEPAQNSSTGAATATTVAATTTTAIATKYLLMSLPAWQKAEPQGEPRNTRVRPDQSQADPADPADHPITVPRLRSRPARPSSIEQAIDQCDFATASTSTLHKSTRRRRRRCQFPSAVATGPKVD